MAGANLKDTLLFVKSELDKLRYVSAALDDMGHGHMAAHITNFMKSNQFVIEESIESWDTK